MIFKPPATATIIFDRKYDDYVKAAWKEAVDLESDAMRAMVRRLHQARTPSEKASLIAIMQKLRIEERRIFNDKEYERNRSADSRARLEEYEAIMMATKLASEVRGEVDVCAQEEAQVSDQAGTEQAVHR